MKNKIFKNIIWALCVIVIILIVWLVSFVVAKNEVLVPSISSTITQFCNFLGEKTFYKALGITLLRSIIAFVLAFIFALIFSIISFKFDAFKKIISPFISIIRSIPTMAITLLLLIYFSPSKTPIVITFLVMLPIIYEQFNTAYLSLDVNYMKLGKIYNLSNKQIINKIILPNISPYVISNLGSNISFSIKLTISAEVLAKTYNSLGFLFNEAKQFGETAAEIFALTIITVVIALIIEVIFSLINLNTFKKWRISYDHH